MGALERVMGERKPKERQIVVRLPGDLAERIDAYGERLRDEAPGPKWTTSDVVRKLLADALDDVETRTGKR